MTTYLGQNVAHCLSSGTSALAIDAALRHVLSWEWSGVLTDWTGHSPLEHASARDVIEIAEQAKSVFVPAFDHEGWAIAELG
jgi:hypothetical protein